MIFVRTVPNVMQHYGCSAEDARRYIDLRDEGYSSEQAALMAGLADPPDALTGDPLSPLIADLRERLIDAAMRHKGDIPSSDCLLYAEAAKVIGQLWELTHDA